MTEKQKEIIKSLYKDKEAFKIYSKIATSKGFTSVEAYVKSFSDDSQER